MTITANEAQARYGDPRSERAMALWDVPAELEVGVIPKRIYCNRDLVGPLQIALRNLIDRKLVDELITWDGCFNIRPSKGDSAQMSLHAWGLAIDLNAAWNRFGWAPKLSPGFVLAWTDAGFEWGGWWRIPDGMHFQLRALP